MALKLLIIEDDPLLSEMLDTILTKDGFVVTLASSGLDGLEAARQTSPDVILLDLMLPEMSGWETCRQIRTFSQVPIVVLSAVTSQNKVLKALDEGADDYFVKPAPFNILSARLKKLAETRKNNA
jgi:DNA-binding response OmpR family regulator